MFRTTIACLVLLAATRLQADPCGMVPPISVSGQAVPLVRVGKQKTFVFYKDGVETLVLRPGFSGKVDEFGMLIPFPTPPALRKVPDNIFQHVAAAIDPPEVVVYLAQYWGNNDAKNSGQFLQQAKQEQGQGLRYDAVRVVKQEAVGMYEVAVLQAGSAKALSRWIDQHGFRYPKGMDDVCNEYVEAGWCFVAVKTRVGQKGGAAPKPGQRQLTTKLPTGSTFDGHVQGMGFRFKTKELVVPMRLSAFNEGELRNVVYLLTDGARRIRSIPEEYVMRQISGQKLIDNVSNPLPIRVIGGTEAQIPEYRRKQLPAQRDPKSHNGAARDLFSADLLAVASGEMSLPDEETEKELLRIGERMGLRGAAIDGLHAQALAEERETTAKKNLASLSGMTLTIVDGDFPREVLAAKNLAFTNYRMSTRRNQKKLYDAKLFGPPPQQQGTVFFGQLQTEPQSDKTMWWVGVAVVTLLGGLWFWKVS